jgi:hypothetical protein
MKRFTCALLGVTALSFLAPAFAHAAAFFIDDTLTTEEIRFTANDFEGGISLNGQLFQQGTNNPQSVLRPEVDATGQAIRWNFSGSWINPTGSVPGPVQVAFLEPGIPNQAISDILFVEYTPGSFSQINGFFISDATEGGLDPSLFVPGVPITNWPETNGAFNFTAPFLTGSANSDVDVPEATSILILGVGACVGALIPLRRRSLA